MTGYAVRRLLFLVPVLWGVGTFVFVVVRLLPGDAVDVLLQDSQNVSDIQAYRHELGLDKPMWQQYITFMGDAATLQFGDSLLSKRPVTSELRRTLPVTLELTAIAMLFAVCIGIPLGALAAFRQDSWVDYGSRIVAFTFLAVPNFWIATMVLLLPAIWWGYNPPLRYVALTSDIRANLQQFIVPGLILGISTMATGLRLMRSQMLEELRQDYVRTALAKGLRHRTITVRHAARNALIPVITAFGTSLGHMLGGTVIIETIFSLPGVGSLTLNSITGRDYPQLQANVLFFGVAFVLINLLVDFLYVGLDPRVQYGR